MSRDRATYRVKLHAFRRYASITRIGMCGVENLADGVYPYQALPEWVKERLATLSILAPPPPENHVEGVGQRIAEDTFWIYD